MNVVKVMSLEKKIFYIKFIWIKFATWADPMLFFSTSLGDLNPERCENVAIKLRIVNPRFINNNIAVNLQNENTYASHQKRSCLFPKQWVIIIKL